MGMGAEGGAGPTSSASLYGEGGTGPGQPGVGSTLGTGGAGSGAGGSGVLAGLQAFMSDPKNVQLLGQIMQQGSRLRETANKLPPDAKRFFEAAMARGLTAQSSGPGGAPVLGSMQPTQGPYLGDAASYNIDPAMARNVLSRMGIM